MQEKSTPEITPPDSPSLGQLMFSLCMLLITVSAFWELFQARVGERLVKDPDWSGLSPAPLVMKGGDPYIRALMRTISASESNDPRPYSLLYGGSHFQDFGKHPDVCIPIVAGPNYGDCTTAAGRYQFLTTTWVSKAEQYHDESSQFMFWGDYSFSPENQDEVVHAWLSDSSAWGVDIAQLLRNGELNSVLQILSGTWTSLGYGIETNSMSGYLPEIYQQMLQEELSNKPGLFP